MIAMLLATAFFLIAIGAGYSDGMDGVVAGRRVHADADRLLRAHLGGWLGGSVVFDYGMRVLNLVEEPASRAASPVPHPEEEAAEK